MKKTPGVEPGVKVGVAKPPKESTNVSNCSSQHCKSNSNSPHPQTFYSVLYNYFGNGSHFQALTYRRNCFASGFLVNARYKERITAPKLSPVYLVRHRLYFHLVLQKHPSVRTR
jgi:hypothetical protein